MLANGAVANLSGINTGDQVISDATLSTTDITTNNFSTAKHGFVPKGTNVGNFLKDDGTWGAPIDISVADPLTLTGNILGIKQASSIQPGYITLTNFNDWQAKESGLGNPSTNGYVLSSTTAGARSWVPMSGGGGTWGTITGTLSSQTDLQNELNLKFNKSNPFITLTDAATTTWDLSTGINAAWVIAGNRTLSISNDNDGDVGVMAVTQDATGGRVITFPVGDNTGNVSQNTVANSVNTYSYIKKGAVRYWNGGLFSETDPVVKAINGVVKSNGTTIAAAAQADITGLLGAGSITNTMLANGAVANLSGTNTGDNATNTQYSVLVSNATHTGEVTGATALTITNNAVTLAKMATIPTATILGRTTAGTGNVETLSAGAGIVISGGTISSTSAPSPDGRLITDVVTADVSNSTTTLAKITTLDQTLGVGIYQFKYCIRYQSGATTTGVRFSVNHSGTLGFFTATMRWTDVSATASTATPTQAGVIAAGQVTGSMSARAKSTTGWGTTLGVDAANSDMQCIIEGSFEVTVSGDIQLYHGSEVAAASTVKAGTNLVVTKVN
jgi:hypothetical protein